MSGDTYTLPCGCVALRELERWVSMCAKHEAEWQATHAAWNATRRESQPINPTTV
jgi:hypothetical protein